MSPASRVRILVHPECLLECRIHNMCSQESKEWHKLQQKTIRKRPYVHYFVDTTMPYHHPHFTDVDTKQRAKTITSLSGKFANPGLNSSLTDSKAWTLNHHQRRLQAFTQGWKCWGPEASSTSGSLKTFNDINKWRLTGPLITTTCLLSLARLTQESEKAEKMHKEPEPVQANPLGGGIEGKEWTWPKFTAKPFFTTTIFVEVSQTSILELSTLRIRQIKWIAQKHSTKEPDASHPRLLNSALNPYALLYIPSLCANKFLPTFSLRLKQHLELSMIGSILEKKKLRPWIGNELAWKLVTW